MRPPRLLVVALLLAPTLALAAVSDPVETHYFAAEEAFLAAREREGERPTEAASLYHTAGDAYHRAAAALPVSAESLAQHEELATAAIAAFEAEHRLTGASEPLRSALGVVIAQLDLLTALTQDAVEVPARVERWTARRAELEVRLEALEPSPEPPPVPARVEDAVEPVDDPPSEPASPAASRWRRAGLWTSLGLAGAAGATALATGLPLRARGPGRTGRVYDDVYEAAVTAGVAHGEDDEMCAAERRGEHPALDQACGRYYAQARAYYAAVAILGAALVSASIFGGLELKARRRARRSRPVREIGVRQIPGGAGLDVTLRF